MTKIILSDKARRAIGERLQRIATNATAIRRTLDHDANAGAADDLAEEIESLCISLGDDIGVTIATEDPYAESEDDDDITAW